MNKRSLPSVNAGIISLISAFIILCLVTFAILSLSDSLGEYRYSRLLAEKEQAYYAAESKAIKQLAIADGILSGLSRQEPDYLVKAADALAASGDLAVDFAEKKLLISFTTPIYEDYDFTMTLQVNDPSLSSDRFTIITWKKTAVTRWEGDDSMNLYQPEDESL